MTDQYRDDYDALGLEDEADWPAACNAYSEGLERWDPARHANRPRERAHAEQQLARVVRGYERIRTYQKENKRMPLAPTLRDRARDTTAAMGTWIDTKRPRAGNPDSEGPVKPSLASRVRARLASVGASIAGLPWYAFAGAAIVATAAFVLALDMSVQRANEDGRIRARSKLSAPAAEPPAAEAAPVAADPADTRTDSP